MEDREAVVDLGICNYITGPLRKSSSFYKDRKKFMNQRGRSYVRTIGSYFLLYTTAKCMPYAKLL